MAERDRHLVTEATAIKHRPEAAVEGKISLRTSAP
jgi:hypothetical protein